MTKRKNWWMIVGKDGTLDITEEHRGFVEIVLYDKKSIAKVDLEHEDYNCDIKNPRIVKVKLVVEE